MASLEVLSLAKQGDAAAIASLMNQVTQPLGISVRVKCHNDCLHLLFEGEATPAQQTVVSFVRSSLDLLKIHSLKTIKIYGRQNKSHHASWHEVIQNQSYFVSLTVSDITEPDISSRDQAETSLFNSEIEISETELPDTEPSPPLSQNLLTEATPTQSAIILMDTSSSLAHRPESALATTSETPDYLKRPEAIVFIFLTTLFVFWETYLALLDELAPENSLSCRQLSQRLSVSKSTVRKRKRQAGFSEWSKSLDPEGIAWSYHSGLYCPIE